MIQEKAKSLYDNLKQKEGEGSKTGEFNESVEWSDHFIKWFGFKNVKMAEEVASAHQEAAFLAHFTWLISWRKTQSLPYASRPTASPGSLCAIRGPCLPGKPLPVFSLARKAPSPFLESLLRC